MALPNPINRKEAYLNAIATGSQDYPATPITREEMYLDAIAKNGGGGGGGSIHVDKTSIGSMTGAGSLPSFTVSGETATFSAGSLPTSNSVSVVTNVTGG